MILMDIHIDKILGFEDFSLNFSYPKKIVNTTVPYEYLEDRPNFRFKRINTIMGANASGKSSLGRVMKGIFNFLQTGIKESITNLINEKNETSEFLVELVTEGKFLWSFNFGFYNNNVVFFRILKCEIKKTDSYEKCLSKLKPAYEETEYWLEYFEALKLINLKNLEFGFSFPDSTKDNYQIDGKILDIILKTLDPSIKEVVESKEADNAFILSFKNSLDKIMIQDGKVVNENRLSSGTLEGISIAKSLSAIKDLKNGVHYIDENFSYIQSDVEIAIYNLMIEMLGKESQLFFTTHNMELLDMSLPVHSYLFLKKSDKIDKVSPEALIKRNNQSLKNAVENDVFGTLPSTHLLDNYTSELIEDE